MGGSPNWAPCAWALIERLLFAISRAVMIRAANDTLACCQQGEGLDSSSQRVHDEPCLLREMMR
jgi:hypothetical protein